MSTSATIDFRESDREVIGLEQRRQVEQADTTRLTGRSPGRKPRRQDRAATIQRPR